MIVANAEVIVTSRPPTASLFKVQNKKKENWWQTDFYEGREAS